MPEDHPPSLFVRLFLIFQIFVYTSVVKAHLPNLPLGGTVPASSVLSDLLTRCPYLSYVGLGVAPTVRIPVTSQNCALQFLCSVEPFLTDTRFGRLFSSIYLLLMQSS